MSTAIEWTDETWNPVTGCDQISPGCDNCYALTLAKRLKAMGQPKYQADGDPRTSGPGFGVTLHPDELDAPHRWRKPRRVFVNSMSDLFHRDVPDEFIYRVFATMAGSQAHTFQVLTKRPQRMASWAEKTFRSSSWVLDNVWLGTSIESDRFVWRADHLRATPAAVRFLSLEPLLGPLPSLDLTGIDWVIIGGESGPGARPMDLAWVRYIRDTCLIGVPCPDCQGTGSIAVPGGGAACDCQYQPETAPGRRAVPLFVKQLGAVVAREGGMSDRAGHTLDEFPEDLRIREWPAARRVVAP